MHHRTCAAFTSRQLDPTFVGLDTSTQLLMYKAIAAETESTRVALRGNPNWNFPVAQPVRGFVPAAKRQRQPETTLADLLPWSALLTLEGCAENAARRAGCTKQEILDFALARIFHRSRATNEDGIALVCPKIQVSNLDQRAGNAEAKLYRRT